MRAADAQAGDADAVLVGVERAQPLAEMLGEAIAAVGAWTMKGLDPETTGALRKGRG